MEPEATKITTDLLRSLKGSGWEDIARANRWLSGLEDVDPSLDAEAEAFHLAAQALEVDQYEGERVRLTGYSKTETGAFSLGVVEGEFDTITSLVVDTSESTPFTPYTNTMIALCIRALSKDQLERRYIPLHPETILSAEALPNTMRQPKYLRKLRWHVDSIEEIVAAEYSDDMQMKQNLLDELNVAFDECIDATSLRVDCSAYSRFVGARHCGVFVDAHGQTVAGQLPAFVWDGDRPVLELFDNHQSDVRFQIDIDDVQAILPLPEDDTLVGKDLLQSHFGEEFQQIAWQLAKDLSYAPADDYNKLYAAHIDTLTQLLPDDGQLDRIRVTGFAWSHTDEVGALRQEFIDTSTAYVDGLAFMKTGQTIRAVLQVTTLDQLSPTTSRTVYVEPNSQVLLRLEALHEHE